MTERALPQLADLRGCRSRFTNAGFTRPENCSARDGQICHIYDDLHIWNEFLSRVNLCLRECSLGRLCLFSVDYGGPQPYISQQKHQAFTLVYWLLKSHRCVVAVHTEPWRILPKYERMIASCLRSSLWLKRLVVARNKWLLEGIVSTLPQFSDLAELRCDLEELPLGFVQSLSALVETSWSLKTLSLPNWRMNRREAGLLFRALEKNTSLVALSLNSSCLTSGTAFVEYLENHVGPETLRINSFPSGGTADLESVVDLLRHSRALQTVSLSYLLVGVNAASAVETFLEEHSTVTRLSLNHCEWHTMGERKYSTDDPGMLSERILPWLSILRKNRSLEALRLNLSSFTPTECVAFFQELAKNSNIKKVVIEDLDWYFMLRGRRASTQPHSRDHKSDLLTDRPYDILTNCKQLQNVSIFVSGSDLAWFTAAATALQSCAHITTLRIDISPWDLDPQLASVIAQYFQGARWLKELKLGLPVGFVMGVPLFRLVILRSLGRNTSLRKLYVKLSSFTEEEAALLATIVRSSSGIYDFGLEAHEEASRTFVSMLFPDFSQNRTLVCLRFHGVGMVFTEHLSYVLQVVQRNFHLVTLGAHFVAGNLNRPCAHAFEQVASHPALEVITGRLLSVDGSEAKQKIRDTLSSVQGMHLFMRMAGVVGSEVVCHARDFQLTDIDEYSWLEIRRYLRLADIVPFNS
ncbi:hypothetical protein HPB48_010386 [Haemaphysalis longicornis]|uniref:Uncharacterized protein n=1 Tax=Haemaphysalis longicornis TaxID=44386 RepID=A0A9J6FUC3_HAELO|nr:hypothetical protein HPB48_010386 [Haemaphysalis longicornis]